MSKKLVTFPGVGPDGATEIAGILDVPDDHRGVILMAHCFGCTKNAPHLHRLAKELVRLGYAVLRFDFYGLGDTRGDFARNTFDLDVANVAAASAYLESLGLPETARIGHSLGGLAVLDGSPVPVVTIGTPSQPSHVLELVSEGTQVIGDKELEIGADMIASLQREVRDPGVRVLSIHSDTDEVVHFAEAGALRGRIAFSEGLDLHRVDHMISDRKIPKYLAQSISEWLG